jgi:predicted TIM-barrel fold metal-dependent hydrolase
VTMRATTKSAKVREQLDHPVVDADGHWVELFPIFFDYIAEVGSPADVDKFRVRYGHRFHGWYELTVEERRQQRLRRPSYWGVPINVRDRAATALPGLFYDSLDDWGIDLAIVFPSVGLTLGRDIADPELSNLAIRAYNAMVADLFSPYVDRMVPVGVLSLAEPTEAVEQMEHAHGLGLKVLVTGGTIPRTIEADAEWQPDPAKRRVYIDALGVDSAYDYDPVWQKFVDLGIPVTSHSGSMGWPDRSLSSNFVGNHLGHFAQSHHTFARSLFLGGVTERFPTLNFGFLEGGVGWACNLYGDLFGHWEKRNRRFMDEHLKPTNLDTAEFRRLFEHYTAGNPRYEGKIDDIIAQNLDALESDTSQLELTERDVESDDFARVTINGLDDIRRLFTQNFYFGCEADDPMTSIAFNEKMGLQLKPLLGSDIAHFDVIDATEVLEEAYELVEDGHITAANFREFTFSNVVQLYRGMNPDFFKGTVVEADAEAEFATYQGKRDQGSGA